MGKQGKEQRYFSSDTETGKKIDAVIDHRGLSFSAIVIRFFEEEFEKIKGVQDEKKD